MRFFRRRPRFDDLIRRQLDLYQFDHSELLGRVAAAEATYNHAASGEAEDAYGDYMDLVEEAEDELLALRDRYGSTMAARERLRYEREFTRAAERQMPSLVSRRMYERAIDPDGDV
jgi:hypothetical protein